MKLKVVTIRDIKTDIYSNPMFVPHVNGAIRSFGDACSDNNKDNALFAHPEDYELMLLGEFNQVTGGFELHERPVQIAVGSNFKRT